MTKKEIVKVIADELRLPQQQVKEIVGKTFESIIQTLVEEGRIELRNFGVFVVKLRRPRNARNPKTSAPVQVEEKKVVTFQPGKLMEKKVRDAKKFQETKRRGKIKKEPPATPESTATPPAPKPRVPKKPKPAPIPTTLPALPEIVAPPPAPPAPDQGANPPPTEPTGT